MTEVIHMEGISLLEESGEYFLQYDAGELMVKMKRLKITRGEAQRIIRNPESSYEIIIEYQDRGIFGEHINNI